MVLHVVGDNGILGFYKLVDGGNRHTDGGRLAETVHQVSTVLWIEFSKKVDVDVAELREGGE